MPREARIISTSGVYQIRLRGINDQRVFERDYDYVQFLRILQRVTGHANQPACCSIYAYCLHENMVHLLLKTHEQSPIALTMKRITQAYALYFNNRHERHGHLFVNRFDSEPIETAANFINVYKYINRMPIANLLAKDPISYQWCSLHVIGDPTPKFPILSPVEEAFAAINAPIQLEHTEEVPTPKLNKNEGKKKLQLSYIESRLMDITGCTTISDFQTINKATQRHALAVLKDEGASYGQLQRVTGLPLGVIRYAKKDTREPNGTPVSDTTSSEISLSSAD